MHKLLSPFGEGLGMGFQNGKHFQPFEPIEPFEPFFNAKNGKHFHH
jgi:hypothetical protein